MNFSQLLAKLFGTKSQRDLKEIMPYINKVKAIEPTVQALDHNALRERLQAIRADILSRGTEQLAKIDTLKAQIEQTDITEREKLYAEVDKFEKEILDLKEVALDEYLPEVFAIIKDTARRFTENNELVVKATDFDRNLAVKYDFVTIEGDNAIFKNEWVAGGNMHKWEMIHYDV